MKNILAFFCLMILALPVKSQKTSDGSMPQFLFPDFAPGKVTLKNGKSQTIVLNYNTVSEKMVYEKDEKLYDMINLDQIDTVFLQECKFVTAGAVFHEVLLIAPISFYIQNKGNVMPPGTPAGYGGTSQVSNTKMMTSVELSSGYYNLKLPPDFIVNPDLVYWIRKGDKMYSFINEKQFLKIFPEKEAEFKKFIKQDKIKFSKTDDLIRLIKYCNEIVK
jgi:hypothetical protein